MISKYLYVFVVILVLFCSCTKRSSQFLYQIENYCGDGNTIIYQVGNPTKLVNEHFIVVIHSWNGNFKVLLNKKEIYYELADEETADYQTNFEFEAKNSDAIFIVYDDGKCLNFKINDKFFIYEIYHELDENYRVNMKNKF